MLSNNKPARCPKHQWKFDGSYSGGHGGRVYERHICRKCKKVKKVYL